MNRIIRILLAATMLVGVADLAVAEQVVAKTPAPKTAPAPKAHMSTGCTGTTTYLHVDCATEIAEDWVRYDCCPIFGRESYYRWASNHVNIVVRAYRNFQSMCRNVAVHGSDWSRYAVYANNSYWYVCGV
jgi:hypothetical protein